MNMPQTIVWECLNIVSTQNDVWLKKRALTMFPDAEVILLSEFDLTIATVRSLPSYIYRTPTTGYGRTCLILSFSSATTESQNALLKMLEEPPETSICVIVIPHRTCLLPTVLSRAMVEVVDMPLASSSVPSLFSLSLADAMAEIDTLHKQKDTTWVRTKQVALQAWLRDSSAATYIAPEFLDALSFVVSRLGTRGANNRWLLEHVVLMYHQYHGR